MLPWDVTEVERFWRMLCNGPRLCFQEFTLIFLADEKKAKEAKVKAMAGLETLMEEQGDASGFCGRGLMHAAGERFDGRQPDNRDFVDQHQAWGRRGYSFARKVPDSCADVDGRDLSAPVGDNSCRAYSFAQRTHAADGYADNRELLQQRGSNRGRAHQFGQGHVRRGACAQEDDRDLLQQQSSNRGRAHQFDQGHVSGGTRATASSKKGGYRTVDRGREVIRMQAAVRGFITRRRLKQAAAAAEAAARVRNSAAAVVIQASYRRHWARELSRWLRVAKSYEKLGS